MLEGDKLWGFGRPVWRFGGFFLALGWVLCEWCGGHVWCTMAAKRSDVWYKRTMDDKEEGREGCDASFRGHGVVQYYSDKTGSSDDSVLNKAKGMALPMAMAIPIRLVVAATVLQYSTVHHSYNVPVWVLNTNTTDSTASASATAAA
ncbi:hypothetical protein IAQ61_005648 [Plenodomus lingam]|uniref:uncharacterized protein n=1 Tax=Leptosphaeria maculans TaxID=5022 RepID=UPI00332CBD40|nr:hypothetical protein IAQ61_005648 [Plenodomus lingam]